MNSLIYHYETTDSNGTRLVFVGDNLPPQFADMENLAYSIHGDLSAHIYTQYMADKDVNTVFFNYVQDHLLERKLDLSPREGLQYALSVGIIRLTKHEVADDKNDEQTQLRLEIQQTLNQIVAQEKNQTKILQQQLEQETTTTQVLIYTGAFMQGIGSSVWGLATWVKEVSDVVNPVVIAYNSFKAATASYGNDNQFSDELLKLQYRELVQALGFDPSQISQEQLKTAFETLEVVWADNDLKKRLTVFCKEYAQAQHSITITNVAGSAVFEITLAVIILAATGGAGLIPAFASKGHLIRSFNKLGNLLLTFGKQNKKPHAEQKATYNLEQAEFEPVNIKNTNELSPTPRKTTTETDVKGENQVTWTLAEDGTPISAEAYLGEDFGGTKRSNAELEAQRKAGGDARIEGIDDGGHIVAHRFMGDQGAKNLFPQDANLNRSAYKRMENEWADWIDEGFAIKLKIELDPPGAARPDNIEVFYEVIDPKTDKTVFKQDPIFKNQTGEEFERISKKDMYKYRS